MELGWTVCAIDTVAKNPSNVLDDATWNLIIQDIELGMFEALWVATPCNTFSPLREKQPGPRILRTVQEIQGIRKGLTPAEQKQVKESNIMTSRSGEAIAKMEGISRPWGLENPDHPEDKPSLWMMPAIKKVRQIQGAKEINFDQCRTGLDTTKPTKLLVKGLNLDHLRNLRCDHPKVQWSDTSGAGWQAAHRPVVQRWITNPDGTRERASKSQGEYTTVLCRFIAKAMHEAVDKSWLTEALRTEELP